MRFSEMEIRRATLDDLPALRRHWRHVGVFKAELEKRITEFQVAAGSDGTVLGSIGMAIQGKNGRIHTEAYASKEAESELRPLLWERLRTLAANHGLIRVWVLSEDPFWKARGFRGPTSEQLERFPGSPGKSGDGWKVLALRDESVAASVDREFELFKQARRDAGARTFRQAQALRVLAVFVAFLTVILIVFVVWYTFHRLRAR